MASTRTQPGDWRRATRDGAEPAWMSRPASEKQYAYIVSLAARKQMPSDFVERLTAALAVKSLNGGLASRTIDYLRGLPDLLNEQTPKTSAPAGNSSRFDRAMMLPGVYRKDGVVFVVKLRQDKRGTYANELVESPPRMTATGTKIPFELKYRPDMQGLLTEADLWPLAEASQVLTAYDECISCGRPLRAADSVANAIGPVCIKRFAGPSRDAHLRLLETVREYAEDQPYGDRIADWTAAQLENVIGMSIATLPGAIRKLERRLEVAA